MGAQMEDRANSRPESVQDVPTCPPQIMTFRVGEQVYGLGILDVNEIIRYRSPEFPPGEPKWMLGVIHLRGEILPAVDVRTRLGLPVRTPDPNTVYVVVENAGRRMALLVDAVLDVIQIGEDVELEQPPGVDGEASPVAGFVRVGDRTVALLKVEAFVPATEGVA